MHAYIYIHVYVCVYIINSRHTHRHLPEIAAMFPRFKLSTIRNCGHWVHSEDPETTLKNVQAFPNSQKYSMYIDFL